MAVTEVRTTKADLSTVEAEFELGLLDAIRTVYAALGAARFIDPDWPIPVAVTFVVIQP